MWRTAMRCGRLLVLAVFLGVALPGAMLTSWVAMLVVAPLLGASFAGVVALVDPDFPRDPSSRHTAVYAAVTGILLVPFGVSVADMGTAGGVVVLVLLVVGSLVGGEWLATVGRHSVPDLGALRQLLNALPTDQLLHEWQATEDLLRSPRTRSAAAEVRALLLDELTRRDPDGVAEWLARGGASPGSYIRIDRGRAG